MFTEPSMRLVTTYPTQGHGMLQPVRGATGWKAEYTVSLLQGNITAEKAATLLS